MKFSIIIPCYNEAENMDRLMAKILPLQKQYDLEYILVENGSSDCSRDYFRKEIEGKHKNIKVVYIKQNRGYGYGIKQGLKVAAGHYIGWIHADLQILPEELRPFFDEVSSGRKIKKIFMKAVRTNRRVFDQFFTYGQTVFSTLLFKTKMYDVSAVPVLFHRSLADNINGMPDDFSIDIFIYLDAIKRHYKIKRLKVKMHERKSGISSWNHGMRSKIRQSKRIIHDSLLIKRGEKVL